LHSSGAAAGGVGGGSSTPKVLICKKMDKIKKNWAKKFRDSLAILMKLYIFVIERINKIKIHYVTENT